MIEQLTGDLVEVLPMQLVLNVGGVGFALGISATTAALLPARGEQQVSLYTRMIVKETALELYGFAEREERAVFDKLIAISGVGPKLALAVLSTFAPAALATIVQMQDVERMAQVPGVGKKKAQRLLVELQGAFAKDIDLKNLTPESLSNHTSSEVAPPVRPLQDEAQAALLSMGFTPQECELALEGAFESGTTTVEAALAYALKRLGGGI